MTARRRPNILLILTDDQRADTIGALGRPDLRTPHLDGLVRRGTVFRNAFIMGGTQPAVCCPSRNMLLTGRSLFRIGGPAPGSGRTTSTCASSSSSSASRWRLWSA